MAISQLLLKPIFSLFLLQNSARDCGGDLMSCTPTAANVRYVTSHLLGHRMPVTILQPAIYCQFQKTNDFSGLLLHNFDTNINTDRINFINKYIDKL